MVILQITEITIAIEIITHHTPEALAEGQSLKIIILAMAVTVIRTVVQAMELILLIIQKTVHADAENLHINKTNKSAGDHPLICFV